MDRFRHPFGDCELADLSIDNILDFMNQLTEGRKPQTKRGRFTSLQAFFNFAKNNLDPDFTNACDSPMLRKLFRLKVKTQFDILEKEPVDEIIFRTVHPRNRLMLELMARSAMRIGRFWIGYFAGNPTMPAPLIYGWMSSYKIQPNYYRYHKNAGR